MRKVLSILIAGALLSSPLLAQEGKTVDIAEIRESAMKMVDINVKPIMSSNIRSVMDGKFYQTFIERSNGEIFVVSQTFEKDGVIKSFYLPSEEEALEDTMAFIKSDFEMIENTEARKLLSALRMIYNIETVFPMYVNRFRDQWVMLVNSHEDTNTFVGFTAQINGDGFIQKLVYSDQISLSDIQVDEVNELAINQDDE